MVRFVTIAKFCELTGMTPAAVYTKKCKGVWLEGTVWRYAPGSKTILMDIEAYEKWVEKGPESQQFQTPATKSHSTTRASGAGSASKRPSLRPIFER
jgi:hypothetical protein